MIQATYPVQDQDAGGDIGRRLHPEQVASL